MIIGIGVLILALHHTCRYDVILVIHLPAFLFQRYHLSVRRVDNMYILFYERHAMIPIYNFYCPWYCYKLYSDGYEAPHDVMKKMISVASLGFAFDVSMILL